MGHVPVIGLGGSHAYSSWRCEQCVESAVSIEGRKFCLFSQCVWFDLKPQRDIGSFSPTDTEADHLALTTCPLNMSAPCTPAGILEPARCCKEHTQQDRDSVRLVVLSLPGPPGADVGLLGEGQVSLTT